MKLIKVRVLNQILNDEAQKRLDEFETSEPTDDEGRNLEWYRDQSLKPPKDLEESTKKYIDIKDEDYDLYWNSGYFRAEDFRAVVDDIDGGSTVYTEGVVLRVLETARQIKNQLEK